MAAAAETRASPTADPAGVTKEEEVFEGLTQIQLAKIKIRPVIYRGKCKAIRCQLNSVMSVSHL